MNLMAAGIPREVKKKTKASYCDAVSRREKLSNPKQSLVPGVLVVRLFSDEDLSLREASISADRRSNVKVVAPSFWARRSTASTCFISTLC